VRPADFCAKKSLKVDVQNRILSAASDRLHTIRWTNRISSAYRYQSR